MKSRKVKHKILIPALLIMLAGILFNSCESVVSNIDVPHIDPQIVLTAHINPSDSIITVNVSNSWPIFNYPVEPEPSVISNATVSVEKNGTVVYLSYDYLTSDYKGNVSTLNLKAGDKVIVRAAASGYADVYGETIIPSRRNESLELISITTVNSQYGPVRRLKIRFKDFPGEINYYRLFLVSYDPWEGVYRYNYPYFIVGKEFLTDTDGDGAYYDLIMEVDDYTEGQLKLCLYTTDKGYYFYNSTLSNYYGDDFFSEPTIIFSNVKNGLGAITSYISYELDFTIQPTP
jgi:hypothetical protein